MTPEYQAHLEEAAYLLRREMSTGAEREWSGRKRAEWFERDQRLAKDSLAPVGEGTTMVDRSSYDKGAYDVMHGLLPDYSCGYPNCNRRKDPSASSGSTSAVLDEQPTHFRRLYDRLQLTGPDEPGDAENVRWVLRSLLEHLEGRFELLEKGLRTYPGSGPAKHLAEWLVKAVDGQTKPDGGASER